MQPTRKQIDALTLNDLSANSVWEYADAEEGAEGRDETALRPAQVHGPIDRAHANVIVRAEFSFPNGESAGGFITISSDYADGLAATQPVVVTTLGQVHFWCGRLEPTQLQLKRWYKILGGRTATEVFPLGYKSAIPVVSGPVSGTIPGFLVVIDAQTLATRVVQ